MSPARLAPDKSRGFLIPCGGGESLEGNAAIYRRLLSVSGNRPKIVLICARATELPCEEIAAALLALGAAKVETLTLSARADGEKPGFLESVENADSVLLLARQPLRLSTLLGGTSLARLLRRRNAEGMPIAGSAAGAALLAEHMLAGGEGGPTPRMGGVMLAPGLGLSNRIVIDQGGLLGDRLGRLLAALALNPFALGLGLDADTAAFIGPDNVLEVIGSGALTIVDPADIGHSNIADAAHNAPISMLNLRMHVLVHGARYDLDFRRPLG